MVMDRKEYDGKIQVMLNDNATYENLDQNPIKSYTKRIRDQLWDFWLTNKIKKPLYNQLRPATEKCPVFYGLPKTHKKDIPLRPIVDFRYSPGHAISLFLKNILKCLTFNHEHNLRNTYDFIDKIKDVSISPLEQMVSFDVESLFTNIPMHKTIDIALDRLSKTDVWRKKAGIFSLPDIALLLNLVSETYFTWRGNFYKQKRGTPMGSPLSPILAEIFMIEMENNILPSLSSVRLWVRMVDDVFAIIRKRKLEEILKIINNYDSDLSFTYEEETNDSLNFLDVTIMKDRNGSLRRKVYRKKTHSNRYLDWNSFHHRSQKIGVIDSLVMRGVRVCSDEFLSEELSLIKTTLNKNGYPIPILEKRINHLLTRPPKVKTPKDSFSEEEQK